MQPQDEAGDQRRNQLGEARRTRARIFLAVAALFLYSAVTQWFDQDADVSDRLWSAVLALIAVGSGVYFWRVIRAERPPGARTDERSGRTPDAPGS